MEALFKLHNGAITLFINGQPYPFTTYKSTEMPDDRLFEQTVRRSVADLAARGVHVHFVPIFFDWPAPGQYDFARMDWRVGQVLAADPQAWVVIRIQAASMAPKWWMDANPDGVLQFGFGRGVELPRQGAFPRLGFLGRGRPARPARVGRTRESPTLRREGDRLPAHRLQL